MIEPATFSCIVFYNNEYWDYKEITIPAFANAVEGVKEYFYAATFNKEDRNNKLPAMDAEEWEPDIPSNYGEGNPYLWRYQVVEYTQ
jgi:hypothetical protein